MAEYTIDKIEYGGNVYKLQDNESGYVTTEVFYGTCETAAGTAAKVVECANFAASDLKAGTIIVVNFSVTNSAAIGDLTLNVNGTGAKGIKYINNGAKGTIISAGHLRVSTSYPFIFDGTYWLMQFNYSTSYLAMTAEEAQAGTATTGRVISPLRLKEAIQLHAPDEKVKVTTLTSETTYYPILATGTDTATRQIDSTLNGLTYKSTAGTTSTAGSAVLTLGNNIATGSANNERGQLILYSVNHCYVKLQTEQLSVNRLITLPNKAGTLATTDLVNASNHGLMSNTDKIYLDGLSDAIETTSSTITIKNGSSGGRAFYLETNSSDTDDTSLISAITSLGWDSDVIVS